MSVLFFDSFDHYPTAEVNQKWQASGGIIESGGRNSTNCLRHNGNVTTDKYFTASNPIVIGFAYKVSPIGPVMMRCMETGVTHVDFVVGSDGKLVCRLGGSTTIGTGSYVYSIGTWVHYQIKVLVHDTNGGVWVKVNGADDIRVGVYAETPVGLDTRNAGTEGTLNRIQLAGASNTNGYWDDFYIVNTAGSAPYNDFLGDCRVEMRQPSGVGNYAQWDSSGAGANWENVSDGAAALADTDYNSTLTQYDKDTFTYENLSSASGTIYGVQHMIGGRKDDAGTRVIAPMVRQNSTDAVSTSTFALADSYRYLSVIQELNPVTGVAWTIADVNTNAEFGYRLEI